MKIETDEIIKIIDKYIEDRKFGYDYHLNMSYESENYSGEQQRCKERAYNSLHLANGAEWVKKKIIELNEKEINNTYKNSLDKIDFEIEL
jgi:hypothetical protein